MRLFSLLDTQFTQFLKSVQNYFSKILSDKNISFGSNTIFGQIITVVGNTMQNIMLYIEDALVEQNKYTAQRKKSIYGLAALSGYEPSLGKAAIATIKLSYLPNNTGVNGYNIVLKNREQLTCTQNGLKYNIILPQEAVTLNPSGDVSTKYFSAVQGLFDTQTVVSTGGQYYTINLNFIGNIDIDYITVKVNNEEWEQVASLYDMDPDAKQYTVKTALTNGINIIFGNETHGRALLANDVVTVTYLIHDGEAGNLNPQLETYFVFDNTLTNTYGETYDANTLFNVTFAETDPITAGSNSETLAHVKQMIGLNSRSLVLASPENYKALINRFGFCGYNRTWSEANSMTVNSMIIKNFNANINDGIEYFNLTENDFVLSDLQKQSIYSYIKSNGGQLASTTYNILDPVLCKYAMYIYLTLKSDKYNKDVITKEIRRLVGDFFANVQSDKFIPKSDIVQLIKNNIEGIDSIDIYILSQRNEEAIAKEYYYETTKIFNNVSGKYVYKTQKVKVYKGENPNLGLDSHGNIYLTNDDHFPVLMGGWSYYTENEYEIKITDPLKITFED